MFDASLAEVEPSPTSPSVLWTKMEALTGLRLLRRRHRDALQCLPAARPWMSSAGARIPA